MRDIESLKQRIESAEKHNASVELARNRESEALMEMWLQIRTRFTDQEDEIARFRTRLEEMTQKNSELGCLVDDLLATVEGNLDRSRDETVPRITNLAEKLLASEPSPFAVAEKTEFQAEETAEAETESSSFDEALLAVSDPGGDEEPDTTDAQAGNSVPDPEVVRSVLDQIAADDRANDPTEDAVPVVGETLSDGIRDIISKVESMSSSVQAPAAAAKAVSTPDAVPSDDQISNPEGFLSELLGALNDDDGDDDEPVVQHDDALEQELREIESLRNELSGLRDRLSTSDVAR